MSAPGYVREGDSEVAVIRLDRPAQLNAMDDELLRSLPDVLSDIANELSVRAIVLTGDLEAFSAGGDLLDLGPRLSGAGVEGVRQLMLAYHESITRIQALPVPVIAAIEKRCAGAAISLALACDMVVAGESARFTPGFANAGLVPDLGALYFCVESMGPRRAKEFVMLGTPKSAAEAHALGLVNRVVADGSALDSALELGRDVAKGPPAALSMIKTMANAIGAGDRDQSLAMEAFAQAAAFQTGEVDEGVEAFAQRRPANFGGRRG